ncbi:hypothetical protein AMV006 [Betaentomopoxvirus amoorei]|uniref:AMV006 n=1 Tax=Amsacta moorei entomopoxvirus TaxID=28321 RepID=Q9EN40_AMEPV|nr:hypothetical protein AMV006 [Amsacta moorei entomopoxvirus]AAG02712.1 AMV006 [Amsacta moorei entomopoxvirus]
MFNNYILYIYFQYKNLLKIYIKNKKTIKMTDNNIFTVILIKHHIQSNIKFEDTVNEIKKINNKISDEEICILYAQTKVDMEYLHFTEEDNINIQIINNYIHTEINNYCINYLLDNDNFTVDQVFPIIVELYS